MIGFDQPFFRQSKRTVNHILKTTKENINRHTGFNIQQSNRKYPRYTNDIPIRNIFADRGVGRSEPIHRTYFHKFGENPERLSFGKLIEIEWVVIVRIVGWFLGLALGGAFTRRFTSYFSSQWKPIKTGKIASFVIVVKREN